MMPEQNQIYANVRVKLSSGNPYFLKYRCDEYKFA